MMQELIQNQQLAELAELIERFTGHDGVHATPIAPLWLYRYSRPSEPVHGMSKPAFCLIAQGSKQVLLGGDVYKYDPAHYLLASMDLPAASQILEASPEVPYLGIAFNLDPGLLGTMVMESNVSTPRNTPLRRGLVVSEISSPLLDAVIRLMRLLKTPEDIDVLAPLVTREILYRLLCGEQSAQLHQIASANSQAQRITMAIEWVKRNYDQPLHIDTIAKEVHMSASALHHSFKAVTAMSPLQYQKQLRLQEARRLMLGEALDAASASYRVGYESPTQFSREYSRLFGAPPLRDIARLRNIPDATAVPESPL